MANGNYSLKRTLHEHLGLIVIVLGLLCLIGCITGLWMQSNSLEHKEIMSAKEQAHQQVMTKYEQVKSVSGSTEKAALIALQDCLANAEGQQTRRLCSLEPSDQKEMLREQNKIDVFNTCLAHSQSVHEREYCHQTFGVHAVGLNADIPNHIPLPGRNDD